MKPVKKEVRTILMKDNKVITIKYTAGNIKGYYGIPGGEIEENEPSINASIRSFKKETTIDIFDPQYAGNLIVEYPDQIFDFDIYLASEYVGAPKQTLEHDLLWIDIDELLKKNRLFAEVYLLDEHHRLDIYNLSNFKWHFISDKNYNKVDEIFYSKDELFWSEYLQ